MSSALNLLLVEDNEDDYELTVGLLSQNDFKVVWVQTLVDALEQVKAQKFDIILLDLGVPDSQGIATFDALAQALKKLPVIIVLTGNDDDEVANEALNMGAQDYLVKGQVTSEMLRRSLRYALGRHKVESQLRTTNNDLVMAHDAALNAVRAKSEFLANISHEIRTPLSGIVSIAELLTLEECSIEVSEMHQVLLQSSKNLVQTLTDLLDLSKLEAGRMTVQIEEFDVKELLDEVLLATKLSAKQKSLTVDCLIAKNVPGIVSSDRVRIKQILSNFMHNAIKFTEEGSVMIAAELKDDAAGRFLKVSVKDTGIGIPELSKYKIFDPFVQVDGAKTRKYGGTGLGLAISKKCAEVIGAELGFESVEGTGSSFWLQIPLAI